MDPIWTNFINTQMALPYMQKLAEFIKTERLTKNVTPQSTELFKYMKLTPYNDVRVVLIDTEPDCRKGSASGLAYSCGLGVEQRSEKLNRIFHEALPRISRKEMPYLVPTSDLSGWAQQGVLLMNNVATVLENEPFSHVNSGWEDFSIQVLQFLNSHPKRIVFILPAPLAELSLFITDPKHYIIIAPPIDQQLEKWAYNGVFLDAAAFAHYESEKPYDPTETTPMHQNRYGHEKYSFNNSHAIMWSSYQDYSVKHRY